jgi:hypothetical protein
MLIIITKNIKFLEFIYKIPFIKHFIMCDISNVNKIENKKTFNLQFRRIFVTDGTSKQTAENRFKELDNISLNYIQKNNNIIHDVAVSSGITSVNFHDFLVDMKIDFIFFVSDKYSLVKIAKHNSMTFVCDNKNKLMFGYISFFLASSLNKFFPISNFLFFILKKYFKKLSTNKTFTSIMLYDKKLIHLINNNKMSDIEYDIFESSHENYFTFVRCMNILNLSYFAENKIVDSLQNISKSIKQNGILMIGRTINEKNHVSFYKKNDNTLLFLEKINNGSEIEHLIEKINKLNLSIKII